YWPRCRRRARGAGRGDQSSRGGAGRAAPHGWHLKEEPGRSAAVDALAASMLADLFPLLQQEGHQPPGLVVGLTQLVPGGDQGNNRGVMTAPAYRTTQVAGVGDARQQR